MGKAELRNLLIDETKFAMQNYITPQFMLDFFKRRIIGQEEELKLIVYVFYNYLSKIFSDESYSPPSWILSAPSGCGKTEIFRTLRDFCKEYSLCIPVIQIDLSQYTETGFNGKNADEIMLSLYNADHDSHGVGICFLDEADKTFIPSHNSYGEDCNAAAQSNLLMLIEGKKEVVQVGKTEGSIMDSNKTMFVLIGAFQDIRKGKQNAPSTRLGFGQSSDSDNKEDKFYDDVSLTDMIEYGMLEEIAGRMRFVINLHKPSAENMKKIIISKIYDLKDEIKIPIAFDESVLDSFLEICYTNLGVRFVINNLKTIAYKAISDIFFDHTITSNHYLIIDSADHAHLAYTRKKEPDFQYWTR